MVLTPKCRKGLKLSTKWQGERVRWRERQRERAKRCCLNGINANHINVLMFLAKCPGCTPKARSHARISVYRAATSIHTHKCCSMEDNAWPIFCLSFTVIGVHHNMELWHPNKRGERKRLLIQTGITNWDMFFDFSEQYHLYFYGV